MHCRWIFRRIRPLKLQQKLQPSEFVLTLLVQLESQQLFVVFMVSKPTGSKKTLNKRKSWSYGKRGKFLLNIQGPSIPGLDTSLGFFNQKC
jgi:hypothetical protein